MKMKKLLLLAAATTLFSTAGAANAQGIPVMDAANLAQALDQVNAWGQQYQQMMQQYQQAVLQYKAVTGARNLGDIINNPALAGVVPSDISNTYRSISEGGISGLTSAARQLRNSQAVYNCVGMKDADMTTCQAYLSMNAQKQADTEFGLTSLQQRYQQIQDLMGQINLTQDPKAIAELQARIQGETTGVANDQSRISLMNTLADTQAKAAEQALRERQLNSIATGTDGSESFVFVPPAQ
jgi:type IV secretion system protein VirB5